MPLELVSKVLSKQLIQAVHYFRREYVLNVHSDSILIKIDNVKQSLQPAAALIP